MKQLIFCLLLLSIFYNVYQYKNANAIFDGKEHESEIIKRRLEILRDSISGLKGQLVDANYFSLDQNEAAQDYFPVAGFDQEVAKVKEELMALNHQEKGNPLVPYAPINGQKCVINKIAMLNHRWILADFYAGDVRGEVLIQYFIGKGEPTEFKTIETVLYPSN